MAAVGMGALGMEALGMEVVGMGGVALDFLRIVRQPRCPVLTGLTEELWIIMLLAALRR